MNSLDFLEYCVGCSFLILSVGAAVRIIAGTGGHKLARPMNAKSPQHVAITDPVHDELERRVETLRGTRFAPQLIPRTQDVGPPPRFAIYPAAPKPHMPRPPVQPDVIRKSTNVVTLTTKRPQLKRPPEDK